MSVLHRIEWNVSDNQFRKIKKLSGAFLEIHEKYLRIVSNFSADWLDDEGKVYDSNVFYEDTRIFKSNISHLRILKNIDEISSSKYALFFNENDMLRIDFKTYEETKEAIDLITEWID